MNRKFIWIIAIIGAVCLLVGTISSVASIMAYALAGYSNVMIAHEDEADVLKELGLFQGTNNGYELERAPTRTEAGVMLVRLLGKEDEAIEKCYSHPFKDVPPWADEHIGYMYHEGYTKGISDDEYGANDTIDAKSYATMLLRVLDYDDSSGDFSWNKALDKAVEVDMLDPKGKESVESKDFLRDDLVYLSYRILSTKYKDSSEMLIDELIDSDAVDETVARNCSFLRSVDIDMDIIVEFDRQSAQNGKNIAYRGLVVDLDKDDIYVKTALADDRIGAVKSLSDVAKDNNAIVAINGSYFEAYKTDDTPKDPYGILVVDGTVVHNMNDRATIGFSGNEVDIDRVDVLIEGKNRNSNKYPWYGYWINHSSVEGGTNLTIFNEYRGAETYSDFGTNYIVEDGEIIDIVKDQSVEIPEGGFVVNLNGQLGTTPTQVYDKFKTGWDVDYSVEMNPENGNSRFWEDIDYATGAGPALIIDGEIDIQCSREHFTEDKIINNSASRSAIGYTEDNKLMFVVTTCTMDELANIMLELGCYEAMNLDGGASSGLYYDGEYIREPGRDISNIIYITTEE